MPKFYPAHLDAIATALQNIFLEGAYADREISKVLRADKRRGVRTGPSSPKPPIT